VQLVVSFGVVINVAAAQALPALKLVATDIVSGKSGKRYPSITVENPSKTHALLREATIRLAAGSRLYAFAEGELSQKVGIGLVQPGKRRKFVLPVDLPADAMSVQASLDFKPKR
jgi:hypothetical protein